MSWALLVLPFMSTAIRLQGEVAKELDAKTAVAQAENFAQQHNIQLTELLIFFFELLAREGRLEARGKVIRHAYGFLRARYQSNTTDRCFGLSVGTPVLGHPCEQQESYSHFRSHGVFDENHSGQYTRSIPGLPS